MPNQHALAQDLDLIIRLMQATCELASLRLQELENPNTQEEALRKARHSFQMIQDLCEATKILAAQTGNRLQQPNAAPATAEEGREPDQGQDDPDSAS